MDSLTAANTQFSLDFFKMITEHNKTGSVFYSPLSISSALAMVLMGARGDTATQMSDMLRFRTERTPGENPGLQQQVQKAQSAQFRKVDDDVHAEFRKLMSELNKEGTPYALSLANRLYGEKSYKFEMKYLMDTKKFYQAELETVDFKSKAEDARVKINSWVEKQTQEKIKNLLAEGAVSNLTRLVLVNAIYFKSDWESKFKGKDTYEEQFSLNKSESKPVQMMHQTGNFGLAFIQEVNSRILELPYIGKELSMLIILPNEIEDDSTGLDRLERALTYDRLIEWTQADKMEDTRLILALPKFKMEESYDLKDILIRMGMVDAFDATECDLTGMSSSSDLVVSKVVHKSFVEVNEEGTEAAAATAVLIELTSLNLPPTIKFIADHPFLFFIRHNPTQSILFYGRFCCP